MATFVYIYLKIQKGLTPGSDFQSSHHLAVTTAYVAGEISTGLWEIADKYLKGPTASVCRDYFLDQLLLVFKSHIKLWVFGQLAALSDEAWGGDCGT